MSFDINILSQNTKNITSTIYHTYLFILFSGSILTAQTTGLDLAKNYNIHGSSTVIGNNIIGFDSKLPYNKTGYYSLKNDRVEMKYVDIDMDDNTFSSSSADLTLQMDSNNLVGAFLYWAATYPYEIGGIKWSNDECIYTNEQKRFNNFNEVLFKFPNSSYRTIKGSILADLKDSIGNPYVCYADITSLLKKEKSLKGTYTLANMRATQGYMVGGSSGGWMLCLVYKDTSLPLKNIQLYHGAQIIDKRNSPLNFQWRQSSNSYLKDMKLLLGALEGDHNIKTDQLSLVINHNEKIALKSIIRPQDNFFNSSITLNNQVFNDRQPNSRNTLGFDLATINMEYYANHTSDKLLLKKSSYLQFSSLRDLFLLFFIGTENSTIIENAPESTADSIHTSILPTNTIQARESIKTSTMESGFYLITNVFSQHDLAMQWKEQLGTLGYHAETFINPKNNWEYIYIAHSKDILTHINLYESLRLRKEFENIWFLEIYQ